MAISTRGTSPAGRDPGYGDVAQHTYIPGVAQQSNQGTLEFVALCDQVPGRSAALAERYRVPRHNERCEDLLADPEFDAVINLTPPTFHRQAALGAFAAGKHCYSEKPIATKTADADEITEASRAAGLVPAVGCYASARHGRALDLTTTG